MDQDTDAALAEAFIREHGDDHLFVAGEGWFFWQEKEGRWRKDGQTRRIHQRIAALGQEPPFARIRAIMRLLKDDPRMWLESKIGGRAVAPMADFVAYRKPVYFDQ